MTKSKLKFILLFGAVGYLLLYGFFTLIDVLPDRCNPDLVGTKYEYLFVSVDACDESLGLHYIYNHLYVTIVNNVT